MVTNKRIRWMTCLTAAAVYLFATVVPANAFSARDLAYGSQGYDVNELQSRLHLLGYYWGSIDGNFNWDTYWAVRTFQYNMGMTVNGFVDMKTKMKIVQVTPKWQYVSHSSQTQSNSNAQMGKSDMQSSSSTPSTSSSTNSNFPAMASGLSASDLNLMAHVVYGEARGESFTGEVAIAAVILNRLKDPRFPHSVPAIVYQPGAFTAVQDGQVNLEPDARAKQAVMDAVHGQDPVLDAVYYFNPATATSPWIWSRPQILTIGHHIFCV